MTSKMNGCDQRREAGTFGGNTPRTNVVIGGKIPFWALGESLWKTISARKREKCEERH